ADGPQKNVNMKRKKDPEPPSLSSELSQSQSPSNDQARTPIATAAIGSIGIDMVSMKSSILATRGHHLKLRGHGLLRVSSSAPVPANRWNRPPCEILVGVHHRAARYVDRRRCYLRG